jgi:hypothetical protein
MGIVLVRLLITMTKHLSEQFKGRRVYFGSGFQSIVAGSIDPGPVVRQERW